MLTLQSFYRSVWWNGKSEQCSSGYQSTMIILRKSTWVIEMWAELDTFSWKITFYLKEWLTEEPWLFRLRRPLLEQKKLICYLIENNGHFFVAHKFWFLSDSIWNTCIYHEVLATLWDLTFFSNELSGDGRSGFLVLYIEIGQYLNELKSSWTGIFQMTMAWFYNRTHR